MRGGAGLHFPGAQRSGKSQRSILTLDKVSVVAFRGACSEDGLNGGSVNVPGRICKLTTFHGSDCP